MNALARALPGAQRGDVRSLHRARVATRRLREVLPLVSSGARRRKLGRAVRRVTRALGPVREIDVALETLALLARREQTPSGAASWLDRYLRQERQRLRAEMCRRMSRVDLPTLRRRAIAAAAGYTQREDGQRHKPLRTLRVKERVARRAGRLYEGVEDATGLYLPDRLHAVRIAVKKLRYAMEVARSLGASRAVASISMLREIQGLLGQIHDRETLIGHVRALQGSSEAEDLQVSEGLDQVVRLLEMECRQLHGQYVAKRRPLLAMCRRAIKWGAPEGVGVPVHTSGS